MNKYAPLTLRTIAAITSATSAAAAYPAAANLFGALPGGVVVASSAAAIYAGWHIVATSENTDHRIVSGVVAGVFAAAMVAGIHSSGDLKASTATQSTAIEADTLYANQEATRMATLATVAAELRSTSKREFPDQYNELQAQVKALSTPTARTPTATQAATPAATGLYPWVVAGLLEVVSPALLLLAGMFRRNPNPLKVEATTPTATPTATLTTPTTTPNRNPQPLAVEEVEETTTPNRNPQPLAVEEVEETTTPTATTATLTATPYELLESMSVKPDQGGFITVAMIRAASFGCSDWQAREAIKAAHAAGILDKSGEGGATRYTYANKLRIVK